MRVVALYLYPVKGCRAVPVEQAFLDPLGLKHDRRFAFIDAHGRALTQREQPLLATVRPMLSEQKLELEFGGIFKVAIPISGFAGSTDIDVWGRRLPGRLAPEHCLADAAAYFGAPVRLAALDGAAVDAQPVLVTSTDRLAELNSRLAQPLGMERFRPNVVLQGDGDWNGLQGNEVLLEYAEPCARCEVTTIDQTSGARCGAPPLAALAEGFAGNFGVYCRVARAGRLRRGETLETL